MGESVTRQMLAVVVAAMFFVSATVGVTAYYAGDSMGWRRGWAEGRAMAGTGLAPVKTDYMQCVERVTQSNRSNLDVAIRSYCGLPGTN
jgi:hypothetical protein